MAKARPSSSEIDRFLEEVNRRKQQQARQSAPPPRPPVQQQPPPPRAKPASYPKAQKVQQKQVIIVEPPVTIPVAQPMMPEPIQDYTPKSTASAYQVPAPSPTLPRGAESAPVQHARALIRTRDGMRAMFVMNEILSPPRCKQAFRRSR